MSWALLFAIAFFLQVAPRLSFRLFSRRRSSPQPRWYNVLLCSSRHCGITSRGWLRDAHSIVRDGTSVIPVTALDDPNLSHSLNLGVLPLTGPVVIVRMAAASGPLAPPQVTVLRVFASREEPSPFCTRRTLDPYSRVLREM